MGKLNPFAKKKVSAEENGIPIPPSQASSGDKLVLGENHTVLHEKAEAAPLEKVEVSTNDVVETVEAQEVKTEDYQPSEIFNEFLVCLISDNPSVNIAEVLQELKNSGYDERLVAQKYGYRLPEETTMCNNCNGTENKGRKVLKYVAIVGVSAVAGAVAGVIIKDTLSKKKSNCIEPTLPVDPQPEQPAIEIVDVKADSLKPVKATSKFTANRVVRL